MCVPVLVHLRLTRGSMLTFMRVTAERSFLLSWLVRSVGDARVQVAISLSPDFLDALHVVVLAQQLVMVPQRSLKIMYRILGDSWTARVGVCSLLRLL